MTQEELTDINALFGGLSDDNNTNANNYDIIIRNQTSGNAMKVPLAIFKQVVYNYLTSASVAAGLASVLGVVRNTGTAVTNANTTTAIGTYFTNPSSTNLPVTNRYGYLKVEDFSGYSVQTWIDLNLNQYYQRARNKGVSPADFSNSTWNLVIPPYIHDNPTLSDLASALGEVQNKMAPPVLVTNYREDAAKDYFSNMSDKEFAVVDLHPNIDSDSACIIFRNSSNKGVIFMVNYSGGSLDILYTVNGTWNKKSYTGA